MVSDAQPLGELLPMWSVAPFVLLFVAVEVLEVVAGRWWSSLRNKVLFRSR